MLNMVKRSSEIPGKSSLLIIWYGSPLRTMNDCGEPFVMELTNTRYPPPELISSCERGRILITEVIDSTASIDSESLVTTESLRNDE